jgi:hypothetical protein
LENSALCEVPKKDLTIVVCVARVDGRDISPGLKYDKSTVARNTAGIRLGSRIGKLPDRSIGLSPDSDRDRGQGYDD